MREQNLVCVAFSVLFILDTVGINANCPECYFKNGEGCDQCPAHCIFCNSTDFCFLCDKGYSGTTCQNLCDNCKPVTQCTKGDGFCEKGCKDGLSGTYCNKTCDSICKSCNRNDTTECLTYKNQTSEPVCPKDCLLQKCKGNHCSNGCLPGYFGKKCEHRCQKQCNIDTPSTDTNIIVVPVLSAALFMVVGVFLFILCWKRRQSRRQILQVVVYRHQDMTERRSELSGNEVDSVTMSRNCDDAFYDNYNHLEDNNASVAEADANIPNKTFSYAYAMPYARFQPTSGKEDIKQLDKRLQ